MLTEIQLNEIKVLQHECEAFDQIQLKLNWDMLKNRSENEKNDFLHYEEGKLAAFLGIYSFGKKAELCGMVKPEYRRKGIFSNLMKQVLSACTDRQFREVLLNAPAKSPAAKDFLKTISCEYGFSEYQMKWSENESPVLDRRVSLRKSGPADRELEIALDVSCFGYLEQDASDYNHSIKREDDQDFIIIEFENKAVGKMRVSHTGGEAWIYGFAVLPVYQGRGIGRNALQKVIAKENEAQYPIFLEVEAENAHALKLYESCGFRSFHVQDYYVLQN
ncbi:GNAT family N-acetyltransferase [Metabacillus idriensis]|uniref:GNAT family N-acetyltransferase n=1 Tax=Metabacillus idriensis TaxID=324768 RepID=UPI003D2B201D